MAIDWNKIIEQSLAQAPAIIIAAAAAIYKLRKVEKKQDVALANQRRIEEKADGQHAKALEEIHKAGKREGALEAQAAPLYDHDQIVRVVEQVLAAQSKQRGRRRTDPP